LIERGRFLPNTTTTTTTTSTSIYPAITTSQDTTQAFMIWSFFRTSHSLRFHDISPPMLSTHHNSSIQRSETNRNPSLLPLADNQVYIIIIIVSW
jgi:hypothetical protein